MEFQVNLTEIIVALIGVLASIVTVYVVPLLKAKLGKERWEQLVKIAETVVDAAEQLGIAEKIVDKAEYAFEQVKLALVKQKLVYDDETIKAAIEAAVLPFNTEYTFSADDIIKLAEAGVITLEEGENYESTQTDFD